MSNFTLIIGNKNISSWSLRAYLALKHADVTYQEILISLRPSFDKEALLRLTPAGKVPTLIHGDHLIWDSLAICEYLNDLYPQKAYWPDDISMRAHARCVSAELHSGFATLRTLMPMAFCNSLQMPEITEDLKSDIDRIIDIWTDARDKYAHIGPYLFGNYCIADMMFAPVVSRFNTYQVALSEKLQHYCNHMMSHPHMIAWRDEADPLDL